MSCHPFLPCLLSLFHGCCYNLSGISYLSNADSLSQNSFRVQMTPKVQTRLHQRHHLGQTSHPLASHSRIQGRVCVKTSIQKQLSALNNRNCCVIESYHLITLAQSILNNSKMVIAELQCVHKNFLHSKAALYSQQ